MHEANTFVITSDVLTLLVLCKLGVFQVHSEMIFSRKKTPFCWQVFYSQKTMTTDEGSSDNGENPAAAVAEQGEDITTRKDRGVLKVRPQLYNVGDLLGGREMESLSSLFCGGEGWPVFLNQC